MGDDQAPNRMNLDLNLGPFSSAPHPRAENDPASDLLSVNLEDWIGRTNRLRRETSRMRVRNHWRSIQAQVPMPIPLETRRSTGEGSGPAQPIKTCENNNNSSNNPILVDDTSGRKEDDEKTDQGSFFDCNICLDLSINPVVTCCGHLFCWTCIYQWLHYHSDAKECPVCKGEVTIKTVTPIYGRGITAIRELEEDPSLKIPARPQAHRVESWRQTIERNAFTFPVEEMIRRLGNRYDLSRDLFQVQMHERNNTNNNNNNEHAPLLDRIMTSRALRREHNNPQPDEVVDLTESSPAHANSTERRILHLMMRRQQAHIASNSQHAVINNSAERVRRRIFRATHNMHVTPSAVQNQEHHYYQHPLSGEDRDSVSSIAAVIQSGSQMVDSTMEIDSNVSISTSSSRRRQDASRVSDMDSGDSRPPTRRRRIN